MESSIVPAPDTLLSPQQVQAAHLLATGVSLEQVCQTLQIGRATLYRWRQEPRFAAYLHQLLRTAADQALCQSTHLLTLAMSRVQALLEDPNTPPAQQLQIAFRLLALYSRPSHLRHVMGLPDDPVLVAEQQLHRERQAVGDIHPSRVFDGSDYEFCAAGHQQLLATAQAFDARYPNPGSLTAAPVLPNSPKRDKMKHPGTSDRCAGAIDAALSGIRGSIAQAACS